MKGLQILFVALVAIIVVIIWNKPEGLPHRPPTGNHGQGMAPPIDCPRQYKETLTTDDGTKVFLYCWGKK